MVFQFREKEPIITLLLLVGALGDWGTSIIGRSIESLTEGNSIAAMFMANGDWVKFDLVAVIVILFLPFALNRLLKREEVKYFYIFPLIAGIMKIGAFLWNFILILG